MITDDTFATAIEFLINDIIVMPATESEQSSEQVSIPLWVKNNAQWWTEGLITDDDFGKRVTILIKSSNCVKNEQAYNNCDCSINYHRGTICVFWMDCH